MLPLPLHEILLICLCAFGFGAVGAMGFGLSRVFSRYVRPPIPGWVVDGSEHRHCRYCHLGRAYVHEESVRLEADDLVEVRCFVCVSCGLPQWQISRTAVLKKAV